MKQQSRLFWVFLILMVILSVVGCTQPAPTPTATSTPKPTTTTPTAAPSPAPVTTPKPTATPTFKMPDKIGLTSVESGSSSYIQYAALADGIGKKFGVKVYLLPFKSDASRILPAKTGQADFAYAAGSSLLAQEGVMDFKDAEWGPQPIRLVWTPWAVESLSTGTAADANIRTLADLKGKRVAWIPGYGAINVLMTANLAFANLTWNDVQKVIMPSYGDSLTGLVSNKVDAGIAFSGASTITELTNSKRGAYFPPLPTKDVEGWKRAWQWTPHYRPITATVGPNLSKDKPLEGATYASPQIITYPDKDSNLVYGFAKMIVDAYPVYKDTYPSMVAWSIDQTKPNLNYIAPWHEGVIKLFKELGIWTADNDKYQQQMIKRQEVLKKAFDAAIIEAADKKITSAKFPEFWYGKRVDALKAAGLEYYWTPQQLLDLDK